MKLKKFITLVITAALALSAIPAYAEDTEPVKYENELYYIGEDIPADSYIVISKDVTKPAYAGIYTNNLEKGAKFVKKMKPLYGDSTDYIYPHYFETNSFYNTADTKVPDNQGNCTFSEYFEYSTYVDLSHYKHNNARKDFLYLENCYAVSVKDLDKIDVDFNRDGFMPVSGFLNKSQPYQISVDSSQRIGFFACYKYDKVSKQLNPLNSVVVVNKQYPTGKKEYIYGTGTVSVHEKADVILKIGVSINDIGGNTIYPYEGITFPDNYTEKYNFNDVNTVLKDVTIQEFKALREEEIAIRNSAEAFTKSTEQMAIDRRRIFRNLKNFAKTDADYEYIKYVREAYAMYAQSPDIDKILSQYLYNATSFEDLSKLLRIIAYNDYRSEYYQYTLESYYRTYRTTENF